MTIAAFGAAMQGVRRHSGIVVRQTAFGVPDYQVSMGPFPARIRVGLDLDPAEGLVPEVVLDIIVGAVVDRWAALGAWSAAPSAAMAEHGLPHPLPVPDLTFPLGMRRSAEIAFRADFEIFDSGQALVLLHVGAAYASFMARELVPAMDAGTASLYTRHGIVPGSPVPMPRDILASDVDHGRVAWAA